MSNPKSRENENKLYDSSESDKACTNLLLANPELLAEMVGNEADNGVATMLNAIPGKTWQEKLDNINTCHCCRRHERDRPFTFATWNGCQSSHQQTDERCFCWCRYLARKICEQPPQTEVPKSKSENDAFKSARTMLNAGSASRVAAGRLERAQIRADALCPRQK